MGFDTPGNGRNSARDGTRTNLAGYESGEERRKWRSWLSVQIRG